MSFHREPPPKKTERSITMADIKERESVIDSSTTWRMESELTEGISKKKRPLIAIP
jgi:hypothetical protein